MTDVLRAPHALEYTYTRSVGPVVERFFNGLAERRIQGIRGAGGYVIVPPTEYDPDTGESLSEFVDVGDSGVVTTWAWATDPRLGQPLDRPFAWALIKLDGADTAGVGVLEEMGSAEDVGHGALDRLLAPGPVRVAQLALVELAVRIAGKLGDEVDRLRQLVLGQSL